MAKDFDDNHRKWGSCDPFQLFDAEVLTIVPSVSLCPCPFWSAVEWICEVRRAYTADSTQNLKAVERNLKTEARNADMLMIWTDCDREGEHIGSEVATVCRSVNRGLVVKRARFSAIIAAYVSDSLCHH